MYRVTVIIPTYNRKAILQRSLKALEEQSAELGLFEVIVVDDGSTDGTASMVQEFLSSCKRPVRYFWQNNKKQGVARNLGAYHAEGGILLFLGDDIIASPTLIEQHVLYHDRHSSSGEAAVLG